MGRPRLVPERGEERFINAAHYLEADLLQEFADWSRETGLILPEAPYESR